MAGFEWLRKLTVPKATKDDPRSRAGKQKERVDAFARASVDDMRAAAEKAKKALRGVRD